MAFAKTPHPSSCSLESDMDLLQADKNNFLSAKKSDNQNNFCPASCYFSLSNRCRKSLPGKASRARRRDRLTSELLSLLVRFSAGHIKDTPKALVAVLSTTFNSVKETCWYEMMEKKKKKKTRFQKYVSAFGIKSVRVHDVIPVSRQAKAEKLQRNSIFFFFTPPWKLICDPLMKSSSFGIKLNVQRYLSVGISLIAPEGSEWQIDASSYLSLSSYPLYVSCDGQILLVHRAILYLDLSKAVERRA